VSVTPSTLKPGKSATLTVTLTNTGNTTATGEAVITIGLSSDGVTPTTPITTLEQPEAVRVGHPVVLHLKFKLPDSTVAGNYFPFVTYIQAGASAKIFGATATAVG
jgi:uncharacterized repeat protein (TIGR01451 family)